MNEKEISDLLTSINSNEYRIIIESKDEKGRKLLSNIIKNCLENDYSFRTLFVNAKIVLDDVLPKGEDILEQYTKIIKKEEKRE